MARQPEPLDEGGARSEGLEMTRVWGCSNFFVCDRGEVVVTRAELREAGIRARFQRGGFPVFAPRKNAAILDDLLRHFAKQQSST